MEIDEVAARLLRQYWALLVICVAVPLVVISYIAAKQPAMYSACADPDRVNDPALVLARGYDHNSQIRMLG